MIKDSIIRQKAELERKWSELYIPREVSMKAQGTDLIKVIIGPRRAGKSFFALHALRSLAPFGYINFDDEVLADVQNYDELMESLQSVYPGVRTILFDEIQNLSKWELFVNRLQRQGFELYLTGSNSRLLSMELASHLTGRYQSIYVFPFSFQEYLKKSDNNLTTAQLSEQCMLYIQQGGYPEPLLKPIDRNEYLLTMIDSIIYKDVIKRHRLRGSGAIGDLAWYILSNPCREYSFNTLSQVTKCRSVHTVEKYIGYLEEALLVFRLHRFSWKVKEQISFNRKFYCFDNGLITAKSAKHSLNSGHLFENAVATVLKQMEMNHQLSLSFWKADKEGEVDFVVQQNNTIRQLIQVCYDLNEPGTKEREIRSLLKASESLHCSDLLVLTYDYEGVEDHVWYRKRGTIRFIPLWKWLLYEVKNLVAIS
jgi:predicted AAA+ superfamily ATPase